MPVKFIETFTGREGQSVDEWINSVEFCANLRRIPEGDRFSFATKHLSDPVRDCVMSLTSPLEKISGRTWEWDWSKLKAALRGIDKQIKGLRTGSKGRNWLKVAALGALVGATGPFALGLSLTATVACAFGGTIVALGTPDSADVMAVLRTSIIAGDVGNGTPPPGASKTIQEIQAKGPSKSWLYGAKFNPSLELVAELFRMLVPGKNIR